MGVKEHRLHGVATAKPTVQAPQIPTRSRLSKFGHWAAVGVAAVGSFFVQPRMGMAQEPARPVAVVPVPKKPPESKTCSVTTADLTKYDKETGKYRLGTDQVKVNLPDGRTFLATVDSVQGQGYFALQIAGKGVQLPLKLLGINDPSKVTILVEVGEDSKGTYYTFYAVPSDLASADKALALGEDGGQLKGSVMAVCKAVASR